MRAPAAGRLLPLVPKRAEILMITATSDVPGFSSNLQIIFIDIPSLCLGTKDPLWHPVRMRRCALETPSFGSASDDRALAHRYYMFLAQSQCYAIVLVQQQRGTHLEDTDMRRAQGMYRLQQHHWQVVAVPADFETLAGLSLH